MRVVLAFVERTDEGDASLVGYLMALVAAFGWPDVRLVSVQRASANNC